MKFKCAHCGKMADKPSGHINRARSSGNRLFCGRKCSGLGRRKPKKTKAQHREDKRIYDANYRKSSPTLKARRRACHLRTYDPAQAAIDRRKRAPAHAEYCRQPWYRGWKRDYDRRRRAGEFGEFADAYTLTLELTREVKRRDEDEQVKY